MSKKTVLIVEDEIILQDVYKLVLDQAGYDVHTASDGTEGLAKFKKLRPDLVLLDIFMPLMDGREFLRNVDLADYPSSKIIVYTNLFDKATQHEMIELGAHDFVLKSSMTPNDLLALAEKHLS